MFEFLNGNPLIVLAFGVAVTFVLMFIFVKPSKKSKKKSESKKDDSKDKVDKSKNENVEQQPAVETEVQTETQDNVDKNKISKKRKKVHKSKSKPEVTHVYKKVEENDSFLKDEESGDEKPVDDLEKRAQFVKTSSKISKFIGLSDVVEVAESEQMQPGLTEMPVQDIQEDCEICKKIVKHFDHSRRLSKMVQENAFDDMLEAHISDHYLKIDSNRHLGSSSDFSEKLFDRALSTLANSNVKVLANEDQTEEKPVEKIKNDRAYMKMWLENRKREELNKLIAEPVEHAGFVIDEEFEKELHDDIDLSPKNIVVVDSILHRKGRNKRS